LQNQKSDDHDAVKAHKAQTVKLTLYK